jgi:hypothetical protein
VSTILEQSSDVKMVASTEPAPEPASWPEIPMGYLMVAGVLLATVFLGGLFMAAQSREARALAQMRHDVDRWAFRMAV